MKTVLPWLLVLVACDPSRDDTCSSSSECSEGQQCLVRVDTGQGRCLDTPGRDDVEAPPLRWISVPEHTDVLLVVDDGPSMAPIQARLVASLGALVEQAYSNDLRVLVTTANAQSPVCEPSNAASDGRLVARSCLDRLEAFVGSDGTDARWLCTDTCSYTTEELGLTPERPWIDVHRLPEGIDPVEALACLAAQGISGCEHAAPIRAAALALEGFEPRLPEIRQVVIATDGVDCSVTEEGAAAFDPEGLRALWSDPDAEAATPAVCWNAGVACEGDPAGFDLCAPVDHTLDGAVFAGEGAPVLHPLTSFTEAFRYIDVHVITGTPSGASAVPEYSAVGDPAVLLEHGIDPGCSDGTVTALPPVRLRELATSTSSACDPDYTEPLRGLVPAAGPACVRPCAAAAVDVMLEPPNEEPVALPRCEGEGSSFVVPAGAPGCFAVHDDAPACVDAIAELSTELVLRMRNPFDIGTFLISPDPWQPIAGCEE